MKQRKILNVGDKVKFFGFAINPLGHSYRPVLYVVGDCFEVISVYDSIGTVHITKDNKEYIIDRRQVYAVKRKKKAVKVISDERFYFSQYTDHIYDNLNAARREAEISGNEILELGIVARHKLGDK